MERDGAPLVLADRDRPARTPADLPRSRHEPHRGAPDAHRAGHPRRARPRRPVPRRHRSRPRHEAPSPGHPRVARHLAPHPLRPEPLAPEQAFRPTEFDRFPCGDKTPSPWCDHRDRSRPARRRRRPHPAPRRAHREQWVVLRQAPAPGHVQYTFAVARHSPLPAEMPWLTARSPGRPAGIPEDFPPTTFRWILGGSSPVGAGTERPAQPVRSLTAAVPPAAGSAATARAPGGDDQSARSA